VTVTRGEDETDSTRDGPLLMTALELAEELLNWRVRRERREGGVERRGAMDPIELIAVRIEGTAVEGGVVGSSADKDIARVDLFLENEIFLRGARDTSALPDGEDLCSIVMTKTGSRVDIKEPGERESVCVRERETETERATERERKRERDRERERQRERESEKDRGGRDAKRREGDGHLPGVGLK
jgi:hypothetical protein